MAILTEKCVAGLRLLSSTIGIARYGADSTTNVLPLYCADSSTIGLTLYFADNSTVGIALYCADSSTDNRLRRCIHVDFGAAHHMRDVMQ